MAGVPLLDRCPGVLRPHQAEDGLVVRLRIPGGQTTAAVLSALCGLAAAYSIPRQRRVRPAHLARQPPAARTRRHPAGRADQEIFALGLLPSFAHERVRNIVASPLTGLSAVGPTCGR